MVMHANTPKKKKNVSGLGGKKASYSNHRAFYMSEIMKKLKGCENHRNTLPLCFCRIQNNQQRIQLFHAKNEGTYNHEKQDLNSHNHIYTYVRQRDSIFD